MLWPSKRAPKNSQRALLHCVTCRALRLRCASPGLLGAWGVIAIPKEPKANME